MQTITRDELQNKIQENKDYVLLEVLDGSEYQKAHLPTARNIPLKSESFESDIQGLVPDKNVPVIVYCKNTECPASEEAAKKIEGLGYKNVMDYSEGKEGWRQAGNEIVH